ncbi:hypothetical protein SAMN05660199_03952 [Klenkia soli]|uniref:Uncharacterized protein n=1 Tax=Klenkia soli TaxID=1052260 RepID=A0A1H0SY08_9ACTN|nr:hypothetical protein SAMN05660199_03952 [Klenkia soli]
MSTGVAQAEANRDDWWWSPAMAAVRHLAASGLPFTAWDLTDKLGVPDPDHPARWGGLFYAARTAGIIERAGITESSRPSRSGGLCRVWRGVRPG